MNVHARSAWRLTSTPTMASWKLLTPRQRLELIHQPWADLHAKQKDSA